MRGAGLTSPRSPTSPTTTASGSTALSSWNPSTAAATARSIPVSFTVSPPTTFT